MLDDAELLRRYAEDRSEAAFAQLVERYMDLVYSAALRQVGGDAHRAKDVAQVVFTTLARKSASLTHHPVLAGWLYTATQHAASKIMRTEYRRRLREQSADAMETTLPSDTPPIDWDSVQPVLDDAMRELNDRDREAVLLRFFAHRPFSEIGATLHLSDDAARMRVDRALEKLRARLARHGITSTATALSLALSSQAVTAAPAGIAQSVTCSALASATVATTLTPAITFLQIMSSSQIVAGAVALAVALMLTAVQQVHASRKAEVALTSARREQDARRSLLRDLQQRADHADRAGAELKQSIDKIDLSEGERFLARHPEVKRAALDHKRAEAAGRYRPLFKALRLSPSQIEQFKDILAQSEDIAAQIFPVTITGSDGKPVQVIVSGNPTDPQPQLRALLGDDGFKAYQEFNAVAEPAWQLTTKLAGTLYDTTSPLTASQGEHVFRILSENRASTGWSKQPQYDWNAIMPEIEGLLSEAQLAALSGFRASDEYLQAEIQSWSRNRQRPPQNGAPASPGK